MDLLALTPGHGPLRLAAALFIAVATLLAPSAAARGDRSQLVAAFVYRFSEFAEWPGSAFADDAQPLELCVLGSRAIAEELASEVRDRTHGDRPLRARLVASVADATTCHVLHFGKTPSEGFAAALSTLRSRPVLTIGETPGFAERGGIISFVADGHRLAFEINHASLSASGLRASSQILRLGRPVESQPGSNRAEEAR